MSTYSDEVARKELGVEGVYEIVEKARLGWYGHVSLMRLEMERIPKRTMEINYSSPLDSLVLTDSSQLTSDSQHLGNASVPFSGVSIRSSFMVSRISFGPPPLASSLPATIMPTDGGNLQATYLTFKKQCYATY
uniref:(California timema) hypothetical protein n=1 Tax=Timema californicum TaxID=61474 RepID=A0A7R9PBM2_TIMCA|nr:unnamed protein product [Timema californicum]